MAQKENRSEHWWLIVTNCAQLKALCFFDYNMKFFKASLPIYLGSHIAFVHYNQVITS